jgi:hypothetical protein
VAQAVATMTNRRTLLVLLIVFGALVAVLVIQSRPLASIITQTPTPCLGENCPTATPLASTRIFPDWTISDVKAVRLQNPRTKETLTFTRSADGQWTAAESAGVLNQEVADGMVQAAISFDYTRILEGVAEDQWADYGLTVNFATLFIQIILTNDETHYVIIGGVVPTGESFYGLVDDNPEIYVLAREGGAIDFILHYFVEAQNTSQ